MSECTCELTNAAIMDALSHGREIDTVRDCPIHSEKIRRRLAHTEFVSPPPSFVFDPEDWLLAEQKIDRELDRLLTAEGRERIDRALEDQVILGYN